MKVIVNREMRRKLQELADLMPVLQCKIKAGKVVPIPHPRNHRKLLLKAFKTGGREAVEKYIADFKDEYEEIKALIQFDEFNKK